MLNLGPVYLIAVHYYREGSEGMTLSGKKIILGITGGIAAYKAAQLLRLLKKSDCDVTVVMTSEAEKFITPLTLQALSGKPVLRDIFSGTESNGIIHISTASEADLVVIAPATANTIAKIRTGIADNLLTSIVLATSAKILLAPAMNRVMWENSATQENIEVLKKRGFLISGPATGFQACGDNGIGRMQEPQEIFDDIITILHQESVSQKSAGILSGRKVVITAGPTIEPLDPVRFISNRSSGKMGYAIAEAAVAMGAQTVLISGPVSLSPPAGVSFISVNTALEMHDAVMNSISPADVFIGTAAVADYRAATISPIKIKKSQENRELNISLIQNPDILSLVGHSEHRPSVVAGFAAETGNLEVYALKKLTEKNADIIFGNDVSDQSIGFNSDQNEITVFTKNKKAVSLPRSSKKELGVAVLQFIAEMLT